MTLQSNLIFWTLTTALFISFITLFQSVLLPFVLGMVIAYLLDPLVEKMVKAKMARGVAALIIVASFYIVMLGLIAVISPILYSEATDFATELPQYLNSLRELVAPYTQKLEGVIGAQELSNHAGKASEIGGSIAAYLAAGGIAVLDIISLAVITPIVAYFMMKEWGAIINWFEELLPKHMKTTIKDLLSQINTKLAGFIRGQVSVAVILGGLYAIALTLAGLKYGFLIGLVAGLLSIIPMLGSILGLVIAVVVAGFQSGGDISFIGLIAAIFIAGQVIEGNFLTPRLVGGAVGLHPLWIFFALMAGGSLFGILGMLIAVPVAAIVSVLASFGIKSYKAGSYYKATAKPKKAKAKAKVAAPKKKTAPAPRRAKTK